MAQGDVSNAKDDSRFYSEDRGGGASDLAADLSHRASDLTAGASHVYESGAQARWDVGAPAAWEIDTSVNDTDAGYLYVYESGGNGVRLTMSAGGVVTARVNGTDIGTVTIPNLDGSGDRCVISWSMEANPLTTGASDAVRSEVRVWNVDEGGFDQLVVTHAAVGSANATAVWLASNAAGGNAWSGRATRLRFSAGRFHPASEAREDFVTLTNAPSLALDTRLEVPVPTRDSGVGAHDYFAGPVYQAVAAGLAQTDLRQVGPVWNEHYRDTPDQDQSPPANRGFADPDGDGFTMLGQYLLHRPVPLTANRLKVRVHVQAWRTDAGDDDNVVIRCYSMNRPPVSVINAGAVVPSWSRYYQTVTVNADHGNGTTGGAWYTFDLLQVAREPNGAGTWVCLAFAVADRGGVGLTTAQRWRVRAWVGEAGYEDAPGELPEGGA